MNRLLILASSLGLLMACNQQAKAPETKTYPVEAFFKNENVGGGSFSPDESKLLVSSDRSGIFNAMALPLDGGDAIALTNSTEESVYAISYFPEDERILYSSDKGGNELTHIFVRNEDGTIEDLTPGEKEKAMFGGWSKDEKSFYYLSNVRDPRYFDLYKMDLASMEASMLYQNDGGYQGLQLSDNERYLALTKPRTTNDGDLYLHDLQTGETKHLSEHEGMASYSPQYFSKDNNSLVFTTNEGSEFRYLAKYDIETGTRETLRKFDWDIWYAFESFNGKYQVVGVNEDAKTVIHIYDQESGDEAEAPNIEDGDITSANFSKSEKLLRLSVGSSKASSNLYVYDMASKKLTKLTETLNPELNEADLVEGKVIRYKSFDGLEIPAIWYQPHACAEGIQVPALIWVHGGPGGQSRVSYFPLIQALVNHGYAVLAVNNRGSSGYGKTFNSKDDKRHGEDDLMDCVKAKEWLASSGVVDMEQVGIIGGSYGGYMVMAALAFQPEEFDVGVNIFGVTNWLRTLKSIPDWWESQREALYSELGDPFSDDSVRLYKISPLFHASNVTKPLMVLQGANDPRVLQVESDEIVEAVKANEVPVEYVLFPDEGHGFRKKENQINGYGQIIDFLDSYLKGQGKM